MDVVAHNIEDCKLFQKGTFSLASFVGDQMIKWTDGWMILYEVCEGMIEWMNKWMNEWTNEWTTGWMNEQMNGLCIWTSLEFLLKIGTSWTSDLQ